MMLRHLGEAEAADRLEGAIAEVVREGRAITYDLKPESRGSDPAGTAEVADAVIERSECAPASADWPGPGSRLRSPGA